jgi:hypothetical protein
MSPIKREDRPESSKLGTGPSRIGYWDYRHWRLRYGPNFKSARNTGVEAQGGSSPRHAIQGGHQEALALKVRTQPVVSPGQNDDLTELAFLRDRIEGYLARVQSICSPRGDCATVRGPAKLGFALPVVSVIPNILQQVRVQT